MNIGITSERRVPVLPAAKRRILAGARCGLGGSRRVPRKRTWTDRALMSLPRDGYKYELSEGEIITSPGGFNHGDICAAVLEALRAFVRTHKLGRVCDGQTGFRLRKGVRRKTVLSPDVSFVAQHRVDAMPDRSKFFEGGPDLAVEVLSPGDSVAKTEIKLRRFFANGTRLGWIMDPVARRVLVLRPAGLSISYGVSLTLDGGHCLPGLRLRIRRIFE